MSCASYLAAPSPLIAFMLLKGLQWWGVAALELQGDADISNASENSKRNILSIRRASHTDKIIRREAVRACALWSL